MIGQSYGMNKNGLTISKLHLIVQLEKEVIVKDLDSKNQVLRFQSNSVLPVQTFKDRESLIESGFSLLYH